HGTFRVGESQNRFEVAFKSNDGGASMEVIAELADVWPGDSIFASLAEASSFYEAGALGYSPAAVAGRFQGLELRCRSWQVSPLAIERVSSSLFDDAAVFPPGTVKLDCGLLMRGVQHEW